MGENVTCIRDGLGKRLGREQPFVPLPCGEQIDPSTPFGGDLGKALAQVKAKTLIMPSMTDRTLPTYLARELYRGIKNATYVEIPSYLGHLAGGPANEASAEYVFVTAQIKKFLSELPAK